MMTRERSAEEEADRLLENDARRRGQSLRSMGILDHDRLIVVARKEIAFSDMPRGRREKPEEEDQ